MHIEVGVSAKLATISVEIIGSNQSIIDHLVIIISKKKLTTQSNFDWSTLSIYTA